MKAVISRRGGRTPPGRSSRWVQGVVWEGSGWTQAHERWLARQRFEERGLQIAYVEALAAVKSVRARREALDAAIDTEAAKEPWVQVVGHLACLRGVSTLTAFGLATEVGEWKRFDGRSIGAHLGLVPSESSSGERRRQGAITKTGNGHARRLLVEAAWHQRRCACVPRPRGGACVGAGRALMRAANAPRSPPWLSPASSLAGGRRASHGPARRRCAPAPSRERRGRRR